MKQEKALYPLYAFSFLKSLQFFGAVAVPYYLYRVEMDYLRMFTLEAAFSLAMMLLEVPTGIVADRWGRKISLVLGALAMGTGFLVFAFFRAFPVLLAAEVLCAAGLTLLSGADRALVYETAKNAGMTEKADILFARYDAAGTAGLLISFPLGTVFVGSGLVPYTDALGLVFLFTSVGLVLAALALAPAAEAPRPPKTGSFLREGIEGFLYVFRRRRLRSFGLNYAAVSALTFFMFWFYQSLLLENGVPTAWFGFVGSAFNAAAMVLLGAGAAIRVRFGTTRILTLTSLLPGLFYLGAGLVPGIAAALAAIFGVTSLRLFRAPFLSALMNEQIEDANRATVLSGISMVERVLIALLYPVVGALTDRSLRWTLLLLGALTVACALLLRVKPEHGEGTEAVRPD